MAEKQYRLKTSWSAESSNDLESAQKWAKKIGLSVKERKQGKHDSNGSYYYTFTGPKSAFDKALSKGVFVGDNDAGAIKEIKPKKTLEHSIRETN